MKLKIKGFNWDEGNRAKCEKHGLSVSDIEIFFAQDELLIVPDPKHSHMEDRLIAVGKINARSVFAVFTWRDQQVRPVSARYMHNKEVKSYEKKISQT